MLAIPFIAAVISALSFVRGRAHDELVSIEARARAIYSLRDGTPRRESAWSRW